MKTLADVVDRRIRFAEDAARRCRARQAVIATIADPIRRQALLDAALADYRHCIEELQAAAQAELNEFQEDLMHEQEAGFYADEERIGKALRPLGPTATAQIELFRARIRRMPLDAVQRLVGAKPAPWQVEVLRAYPDLWQRPEGKVHVGDFERPGEIEATIAEALDLPDWQSELDSHAAHLLAQREKAKTLDVIGYGKELAGRFHLPEKRLPAASELDKGQYWEAQDFINRSEREIARQAAQPPPPV